MLYIHSFQDLMRERLKGLNIKPWSKAFNKKIKDMEKVKIALPSGRTIEMTKAERVSFYLHSLNQNNTRHILGGGYSFSETPSVIVKLNGEDLDSIVGSLTPEERQVAEVFYDWFNTIQKAAINEVSVDLNGHEIAREPDYFPIRTNFLDRFHDNLIKSGNFSQMTLEGMGIFKERQSASNALIIDDVFIAAYKSMKKVASYVGLASPLRSAKSLLSDNDFQILESNLYARYIDSLKADSVALAVSMKVVTAILHVQQGFVEEGTQLLIVEILNCSEGILLAACHVWR